MVNREGLPGADSSAINKDLRSLEERLAEVEKAQSYENAFGYEAHRPTQRELAAEKRALSAQIAEIKAELNTPGETAQAETPKDAMPKRVFLSYGDKVTIHRSNGDIEDGWSVVSGDSSYVIVERKKAAKPKGILGRLFKKSAKEEEVARIRVPRKDLESWQKKSDLAT